MRAEPLRARAQRWLWQDPAARSPLGRRLIILLRYAFAVGRDLAGGQLTLRAMSLVYTTLLSLVPLLAISFSILKGFGVHNQIEPFLRATLEPLGERAAEITAQIIGFVDNMQVGVLGLLGVLLLFYTVLSLMQKIESAFNEVWQVTRQRSLAERFRDFLSVIVVGPVLIFTLLGIVASLFASQFMQGLRMIGPFGALFDYSGRLVPVLLVIAVFAFVYVFVPNTRVRWWPALIGGLFAGVAWNLLGLGFARFVASASTYAAVYSGFATPILFMIWLYLGWLVLLLGASIAFYVQHPEYLAGRRVAAALSIADRERAALYALYAIGEGFYGEGPAVSLQELARNLGLPTDMVEALVEALERADLVASTDDQPARYLPARPWEEASLADALSAVRSAGGQSPVYTRQRGGRIAVEATVTALDRGIHAALGSSTLKQFVAGSNACAESAAALGTASGEERES